MGPVPLPNTEPAGREGAPLPFPKPFVLHQRLMPSDRLYNFSNSCAGVVGKEAWTIGGQLSSRAIQQARLQHTPGVLTGLSALPEPWRRELPKMFLSHSIVQPWLPEAAVAVPSEMCYPRLPSWAHYDSFTTRSQKGCGRCRQVPNGLDRSRCDECGHHLHVCWYSGRRQYRKRTSWSLPRPSWRWPTGCEYRRQPVCPLTSLVSRTAPWSGSGVQRENLVPSPKLPGRCNPTLPSGPHLDASSEMGSGGSHVHNYKALGDLLQTGRVSLELVGTPGGAPVGRPSGVLMQPLGPLWNGADGLQSTQRDFTLRCLLNSGSSPLGTCRSPRRVSPAPGLGGQTLFGHHTCGMSKEGLENGSGRREPSDRVFAWNLAHRLAPRMPGGVTQRAVYQIIHRLLFMARDRLAPRVLTNLRLLLAELVTLDWFLIWLQRYYPDLFRSLSVSDALAGKGLGSRGCMAIPADVWDSMVPQGMLEALKRAVFPGTIRATGTSATMIRALCRDGFLHECPLEANCPVFTIPKTADKCSFIADLRFLNGVSGKPPRFQLPSLEGIASVMVLPGEWFGATLDLTNFYWSLRLPHAWTSVFRADGASFDSLPFGWNWAPAIAQETLSRLVNETLHHGCPMLSLGHDLYVWVYLDDVLIIGRSREGVKMATRALVNEFEVKGLLLSHKSRLDPDTLVNWIGKTFDLKRRTISNLKKTELKVLTMAVGACLLPMSPKRLDAVLGIWNWAFRPTPGFALFSHHWYSWRWNSQRFKGHAGFRLANSILDGCLICLRGWTAEVRRGLAAHIFCVDAAWVNDRYQVGFYCPMLGPRVTSCPGWVESQQQAELFGVQYAIRVALHLGLPTVKIVGDNEASLYTMRKMATYRGSTGCLRMMRALFNFWITRPLVVELWWCSTVFQPADPLSRLQDLNGLVRAATLSSLKFDTLMEFPEQLKFFGLVQI